MHDIEKASRAALVQRILELDAALEAERAKNKGGGGAASADGAATGTVVQSSHKSALTRVAVAVPPKGADVPDKFMSAVESAKVCHNSARRTHTAFVLDEFMFASERAYIQIYRDDHFVCV